MSNLSKAIDREVSALAGLRDELRLQMHLARAEARELFDRLETRWPEMEAKAEQLRDQSAEGVKEVADAAHDLAEEIRAGYAEVKRRLAQH